MCLWQHKSLLRLRVVFWSRIFIVSALMHLILLFFLLCVYKGDNFSYHFSIDRQALHQANIVFLPLQKHAAQPARIPQASTESSKQPKVAKAFKKARKAVAEPKPGTRIVAAAKPKPQNEAKSLLNNKLYNCEVLPGTD